MLDDKGHLIKNEPKQEGQEKSERALLNVPCVVRPIYNIDWWSPTICEATAILGFGNVMHRVVTEASWTNKEAAALRDVPQTRRQALNMTLKPTAVWKDFSWNKTKPELLHQFIQLICVLLIGIYSLEILFKSCYLIAQYVYSWCLYIDYKAPGSKEYFLHFPNPPKWFYLTGSTH